jgi:hypothetical protein
MDYQTGQLTQTSGNPWTAAEHFTGPLIVGPSPHSDGSGTLNAVGQMGAVGQANTGIAVVSQSQAGVTQAASPGQGAGVYVTNIVIPAQSQLLRITCMVTTAFSGAATTFGVGSTASATAFTLAAAANGATLGMIIMSPGSGATQIGNWDNVGNTDVALQITSTNTGAGVMTVTAEYVPLANLAS